MTTDPRPLYARATAQAARLIRTVRPEQLTAPTPVPSTTCARCSAISSAAPAG
ncbi:hypothetical protein ACFQ3Z_31850 [Streptomyces nogalater]